MPWAVAATAAGSIAGDYLKGNAAGKAADQQSAAAERANQLLQQNYNNTQANNQAYTTGGQDDFNKLQSLLGLGSGSSSAAGYGSLGHVPTAAEVMATPGYQFGLDQGQNQLNRQLNASGLNASGAQLKAAAQYGTNYATTKYDNAFNNNLSANNQVYNQLIGGSRLGLDANNSTSSAGLANAQGQGSNLTNAANAQGAATLAQGNYAADALNQVGSSYGGMSTPSAMPNGGIVSNASIYTNPSSKYSQNGSDVGLRFANGGPVPATPSRSYNSSPNGEPVVGSYSPLPSGEGGGLSSAAVLNALFALQQQSRPTQQRTGIAMLQANPVTNPQAVLDSQMRQSGAYAWGGPVHGPGGPKEDLIPAMLSNGEHVMDAASVTAMGNGNNMAGQNKLNLLRKSLKARD